MPNARVGPAADVGGDALVAVVEARELDAAVRESRPASTTTIAVLYAGVVTARRPMSGS